MAMQSIEAEGSTLLRQRAVMVWTQQPRADRAECPQSCRVMDGAFLVAILLVVNIECGGICSKEHWEQCMVGWELVLVP